MSAQLEMGVEERGAGLQARHPRVLALDMSLTQIGVCRHSSKTHLIKPGKMRGVERIDFIVRQVQAIVGADCSDLVVIEGYSFASEYVAHQLGEVGGCVRLLLHRLGIPYLVIAPSKLKQFATGKGNASKDTMVIEAVRRFGFEGRTNDEADAYLLWAMSRCHYVAPDPAWRLTKLQLGKVSEVEWPELERRDAA